MSKKKKPGNAPSPGGVARSKPAPIPAGAVPPRRKKKPTWVQVALLAIILLGAFVRFHDLGQMSFRTDMLVFWDRCNQPDLSAWDVFTRWKELDLDHPPLTLMLVKIMYHLTGMPVTQASVRLIPALCGVLCIPVVLFCGRKLGDARLGLIAALFMALSPLHIQVSREADPYSVLTLGASLMLLVLLQLWRCIRDGNPPPGWIPRVAGLGMFMLTQSSRMGWPLALVAGLMIWGGLSWLIRKRDVPAGPLIRVIFLFIGLAILATALPWGIPHMLDPATVATQELLRHTQAGIPPSGGLFLFRTFSVFSWGWTPLRLLFSAALMISALALMIFDRPRAGGYFALSGLIAASFGFYLAVDSLPGVVFDPRDLAGIYPALVLLFSLGAWGWATGLAQRGRLGPTAGGAVAALLVALGAGLYVEPARAAIRLTGRPTPYAAITAWMDSRLPEGTLVLVDNWYEPWNELDIYQSTNVQYTFTVPNMPLHIYVGANWRGCAMDFFERFADAALLQIARQYWEAPAVGPWNWPNEFFAHHVVITNQAGLELRELGLADHGDFYGPHTNRLLVDIYFNTQEDVLAKARAQERPFLLITGNGCKYGKIWRETGDFRNWRIMEDQVRMTIYNFTSNPTNVFLSVEGLSFGNKSLALGDGELHTFVPNRLMEVLMGPVLLQPGSNDIFFLDATWTNGAVPLFISDIRIKTGPLAAEPSQPTQ